MTSTSRWTDETSRDEPVKCDENVQVTFRRFLCLGTESSQYTPYTAVTEAAEKQKPVPKVIKSLAVLREEGKDYLALEIIKEVAGLSGDVAYEQAIALALSNLVRSQSGQDAVTKGLVDVELNRECDGSPTTKKVRKLDPCFDSRQLALALLQTPQQIKTFYNFYNATEKFQGHCGSGMRRVMQTWYNRQNPQDLWRSTRGQSHHKAVLRKLHYKPADPEHAAMAKFLIVGPEAARQSSQTDAKALEVVNFMDQISKLNRCKDPLEAAHLIHTYDLKAGAVPHELFNSPEVWCALLPDMKLPELLEHLNRLAHLDFLSNKDHSVAQEVIKKLENSSSELDNFKIHPSHLFLTFKNSEKNWLTPSPREGELKPAAEPTCAEILDLIKDLTYKSLPFVPQLPGRRVLVCVDIRPMIHTQTGWHACNLKCSEISAFTTLSLAHSGCEVFRVVTWSGPQRKRVMSDIEIDGNENIEQIEEKFVQKQKELEHIPIDLARPLAWARESDLKLDSIVVVTPSHTYCDSRLEKELTEYRLRVNPKLRYILFASACRKVPISRADPLMLEISGFNKRSLPLMSAFIDEKF